MYGADGLPLMSTQLWFSITITKTCPMPLSTGGTTGGGPGSAGGAGAGAGVGAGVPLAGGPTGSVEVAAPPQAANATTAASKPLRNVLALVIGRKRSGPADRFPQTFPQRSAKVANRSTSEDRRRSSNRQRRSFSRRHPASAAGSGSGPPSWTERTSPEAGTRSRTGTWLGAPAGTGQARRLAARASTAA